MRGIRLGWGSTLPLAVGIAEALEPLVTWLQRRMRRSFAITLVILAAVLADTVAGAVASAAMP